MMLISAAFSCLLLSFSPESLQARVSNSDDVKIQRGKLFRKRGAKEIKKQSGGSGTEKNRGRRFKEASKTKETIQAIDSNIVIPDTPVLPEQVVTIPKEQIEHVQRISHEIETLEVRPLRLDEKALTDPEIQMVNDYYKNNQENNGLPRLHLISKPK
ncbi:hypothetical protein Bealeia1_00052 [Candidatus Bealeia paramacronuclearis]|uniref:Uncharacterized protein n=1 Tax=Candidatus Bealeia paramacronuclearis TaxID=1921001 RepID=A0ABZ2C027_9PROT|nr:hypothetical protein [Candidatus Bealeia paramacronuclearis]